MISSLPSPRAILSAMVAVLAATGPTMTNAQNLTGRHLASVLAAQQDMSVFRSFIYRFPDVFSDLPEQGVTVIAPNDFAFGKVGNWGDKTIEGIKASLRYHVIKAKAPIIVGAIPKGDSLSASTALDDPEWSNVTDGQQVILTKQPGGEVILTSGFATRGTVVVEDILFENGIVQIVDSVMHVPEPLESTARNAYSDIAAFLETLHATGLAENLASARDVTILAPHNAAFQHHAGTLHETTHDDLKRILRYHIIPGAVLHSWEFQNGSYLASAEENKSMTITRVGNWIFANSAQFLQTDILISNGIVHMVDDILNLDHAVADPDITPSDRVTADHVAPTSRSVITLEPTVDDAPWVYPRPSRPVITLEPKVDAAPRMHPGLVGLAVALVVGGLFVGV
ncbi:FAS1 domain-containing protein [Podospora aff. communis PSN243]|uniref:FAS1 domain-containing protein n=1 Tax=Podospora aff. communis PSN243 TaxID=3040156 RepID=A0AAV9GU66_9PEZI|nr:FAS1 domain-containing protein [Podospora aff. communis PSN243]